MKTAENKKEFYIVRGDRSGVFFGNIKERNGQEVTMTNVRRLLEFINLTKTSYGGSIISKLSKYYEVKDGE